MKTMTTDELARWLNSAASYMDALASYPEETDYDEMRESNALVKAASALKTAEAHLTQLRRHGVQQEIIVVNAQGGAK
jgi:hypothetical protein